jgi:hypothetical protein
MKAGAALGRGGKMEIPHINPDSLFQNPAFSQAVMVEDAKKIVRAGRIAA